MPGLGPSRVAKHNASRWRVRLPLNLVCCCWMNRSPRSMRFADADQAVALGGRAALLLETAPLLRS